MTERLSMKNTSAVASQSGLSSNSNGENSTIGDTQGPPQADQQEGTPAPVQAQGRPEGPPPSPASTHLGPDQGSPPRLPPSAAQTQRGPDQGPPPTVPPSAAQRGPTTSATKGTKALSPMQNEIAAIRKQIASLSIQLETKVNENNFINIYIDIYL